MKKISNQIFLFSLSVKNNDLAKPNRPEGYFCIYDY